MAVARNQATHDRRQAAQELREAGRTYRQIADELGYSSPSAARRAALAGAEQVPVDLTPALTFDAEEERLEKLAVALEPKALDGDPASVDRLLKVIDALTRVKSQRSAPAPGMAAAFEKTAEQAASDRKTRDIDASLVESGRSIARQIDVALLDPLANRTRVLYLIPHLLSVLREMQATPAARLQIAGIGAAAVNGPRTEEAPKQAGPSKRAKLVGIRGGLADRSRQAGASGA